MVTFQAIRTFQAVMSAGGLPMQYSKYNHLCELKGDSHAYLLYNFLTGALVKLDEEHKRLYEGILETAGHDDVRAFLLKNGFLIDNFDELNYLLLGNKLTCTDSELLSVLIAPTLSCNFRCPYCFERHGSGMMDEKTQDAIIRFIEKSIQEHHHKQLFVYWFGGEPLLGIDIIDHMAQQLLSLAHKYGVSYTSAMSTNGYFLTPENMAILERAQVGRIQITLDGMKETNDATRVLANGEGSFDVIISNLRRMKTPIQIQIRSNLHKKNAEEFTQLKQLIDSIAAENGVNMSAYGAHMAKYEFNNENVDDMVLTMQEFSGVLKKNGIMGNSKANRARFAFCDAAKVYSYCFDEKGNMYKCWNDIGTPSRAYDNVFSAMETGLDLSSVNATAFLARSFPDDPECLACKVLPLCMGGCILKRVWEKQKTCSPVKYDMDDYVNKKYSLSVGADVADTGN